jgi:DNA-binding NarL/FixJ family response regulator
VDDQTLIRAGFRVFVDSAPDLEVVGEAADGAEALARAREIRPDVVLMDIRMPGVDGLTATRDLMRDPDLTGVRVLVLTTFEIDEHVFAALDAGASGFLGKGVEPEELVATRQLISHYLARPNRAPRTIPPVLAQLTNREAEVVRLVAQGLSNDEIADLLVLSPLTAKTHVNRAMTKLGARDRAQLVVIAYQARLVEPA